MDLPLNRAHGVLVLSPSGRIDQAHVDAFSRALEPHLADCKADGAPVVLDFSAVEFISSVGLRALMLAHRKTSGQGGRFAVVALSPLVKEIFAISHFDKVLKVFDSTAAAAAAFGTAS